MMERIERMSGMDVTKGYLAASINGGYVLLEKKLDLRRLYVEITNRCNLSCRMCFRSSWEEKDGDMSPELFRKLMNQAESFPMMEEVFFGGIGEPTIHPDFIELVEEASKRYRVAFSTNGILMDKIAEEIVRLGVDRVYFSLDCIPPAYSEIGHADSQRIIDAITLLDQTKEELNSRKPTIGVEFVVTRENVSHLPHLPELRKIGVAEVIISNIIPTSKETVNAAIYGEGENGYVDEFIRKCFKGPKYVLPEFKIRTERRCEFVKRKSAVVRWDGSVAPCYRLLHSYKEYILGREVKVVSHTFGNVKGETLENIWLKDEYVMFRYVVDNSLYASCIDCKLAEGCYFSATTQSDCFGNSPSCGDCLWSRRIVICP